jgi:hypothetical protein
MTCEGRQRRADAVRSRRWEDEFLKRNGKEVRAGRAERIARAAMRGQVGSAEGCVRDVRNSYVEGFDRSSGRRGAERAAGLADDRVAVIMRGL